MNKILNLKHLSSVLFVMLCAFLSTTFIACSDEDDDVEANPIANTIWSADDYLYGALFGGEWTRVYEFSTDTYRTYLRRQSDGQKEMLEENLKYTFTAPSTVTIYDKEGKTTTGTLDGTSLKLGMYNLSKQ